MLIRSGLRHSIVPAIQFKNSIIWFAVFAALFAFNWLFIGIHIGMFKQWMEQQMGA